jgi:hypothetical protein
MRRLRQPPFTAANGSVAGAPCCPKINDPVHPSECRDEEAT